MCGLREEATLGSSDCPAIDGASERTFTLPCGDRKASGALLLPLVASEFVAIKAGDGGVVPDMATLDLHAVGARVAARKAELMGEMSEGMEVVG